MWTSSQLWPILLKCTVACFLKEDMALKIFNLIFILYSYTALPQRWQELRTLHWSYFHNNLLFFSTSKVQEMTWYATVKFQGLNTSDLINLLREMRTDNLCIPVFINSAKKLKWDRWMKTGTKMVKKRKIVGGRNEFTRIREPPALKWEGAETESRDGYLHSQAKSKRMQWGKIK